MFISFVAQLGHNLTVAGDSARLVRLVNGLDFFFGQLEVNARYVIGAFDQHTSQEGWKEEIHTNEVLELLN